MPASPNAENSLTQADWSKSTRLRRSLLRIPAPSCNLFLFLLSIGAVNSAVFQWPLFKFANANLNLSSADDWLTLSTVFVLQFFLTVAALAAIAIVSAKAAKVSAALLFLGNSIALYFINSFSIVLDKSMLGNIFNTSPTEAAAYLHYKLLVYVIFLGVIPCLLISWTKIRPTSRSRRGAFLLAGMVVGTGWLYANSQSWLWVDKHASRLGALILPWSYVVNAFRYCDDKVSASSAQLLLPPARSVDSKDAVVILVIGESARAANFSLYGYQKPTNPLLAAAGAKALPNARSCATYTTASLKCMMNHRDGSIYTHDSYEPLPTYVQRHGVEVTWRANNWGQPPIKVAKFESADQIRKTCVVGDCARLAYDEVLLHGLESAIRTSSARKKLIVLHTTGSHGPQYFSKYPPEFEVFKPACRTVNLSECTTTDLINAYDNTILYTDYFLNRVITILKSLDGVPAVMLYVSDHGESLGEYGLYLHGTPYSIAPDLQKDIPFIVWTSDNFAGREGLSQHAAHPNSRYTQDFIFHSTLGALGMTSDFYNKNLDIFSFTSGNKP